MSFRVTGIILFSASLRKDIYRSCDDRQNIVVEIQIAD
jgi:hypothetical protein